ncbi:membrane protein [Mycobacterium phage Phabba]|uniref:Membrane protein n=1 Tax=Mycobacterium phage Phabba TaxID=2027899 RepID=A0A249XSS7_9CAUD|nr:membrane protein [Mycobacterium phage Phabba]ASZ74756.1 membrane protein [Mycobacterium phage Phabba]
MSKELTEKQASRYAAILTAGLVFLTALTVGIYGVGIWQFLTVDDLPARTVDTGFRLTGIAFCLIPILLNATIWVILVGMVRIQRAQDAKKNVTTDEGVTPSD